ncbi:hypothetical protein L1887_62873 [Cichorium endivia]|nr:hypothetical protein L1887_62873 [Cichorium endivia]
MKSGDATHASHATHATFADAGRPHLAAALDAGRLCCSCGMSAAEQGQLQVRYGNSRMLKIDHRDQAGLGAKLWLSAMAEPLQDPTRKFVAKRGQRAPGKI